MWQRIIDYGLRFAVLMIFLSSCAAAPARVDQATYWPVHDWRASTPEEQGLDSTQILAMLQEIQNKNLSLHSLLIIRHGYLVTEVYFPPYQREFKHPLFSMTKSVTSALVGKALQEGRLKNVQQKVLEFFPDIAREVTDPKVKDLTLEHLLTMSAGFNTNTMPDLSSKAAAAGTIRHILTYDSILVNPGTSFYYDSGLPHLLSAVIQKATGMTLQEYAQQELFDPLGISNVDWAADPQGVTIGSTGLMLRSSDIAKLGYLYLHHGQWNGSRVLPEEWVAASTSKHMETRGLMNAAEDDGYGYLWWIDAFGGYSAHGFGGQYLFVLPQLDMVVVFTGGLPDPLFPTPKQLVTSYLIPAARSTEGPLTPNIQASQALASRIQEIEHPDRPGVPLPDMARRISGKTFQLTQASPTGAWSQAVTYTFDGGTTYQIKTLWPDNQTVIITGGLNNVFRFNSITFKGLEPEKDLVVAIRGYWRDDHTFVEEYIRNMNSDIESITQQSRFEGDRVTIEGSSSMTSFSGQARGEMLK